MTLLKSSFLDIRRLIRQDSEMTYISVLMTDLSFREEMNVFNWIFLIGTLNKLCHRGILSWSMENYLETKL